MADTSSFTKFVPGFDFLQSLVKTAGSSLPNIGQWVAPTLNPEELEKRIDELRTVQFWLEQNARMLGVTIQALEVQRMTLSTLKSMNVPMAELSETLKIKVPGMDSPMPIFAAATGQAADGKKTEKKADKAGDSAAAVAAVDPMQWWGALSQQFAQLATNAMKDSATDAAKNLAGAMVKQSFDVAGDTLRKAASVPGAVAGGIVKQAVKSARAGRAAAAMKTAARKRSTG